MGYMGVFGLSPSLPYQVLFAHNLASSGNKTNAKMVNGGWACQKIACRSNKGDFFSHDKKIGKVDLGQKPNIISTKKAWKPNAQVINQDLYNPGLVMLLVAVLQIGCRKLGVFVDCSTLVEEMI